MKRIKRGFTLAEVLITLAIIGVVAALSIPSVISNSQQQEFKTGLRKAVSVLNSAITMNMAIEGESPYENADLYNYLQRHMNVMQTGRLKFYSSYVRPGGIRVSQGGNFAFYTTDGMRFEFEDDGAGYTHLKLHESDESACIASTYTELTGIHSCGGCGSYGMTHNPNHTTKRPCAVLVDVNGDRKPNPANINLISPTPSYENMDEYNKQVNAAAYKIAYPGSKLIGDIFTILITDEKAIPYGVVAQKAMYEAQKQGY